MNDELDGMPLEPVAGTSPLCLTLAVNRETGQLAITQNIETLEDMNSLSEALVVAQKGLQEAIVKERVKQVMATLPTAPEAQPEEPEEHDES